MLRVIRVTGPNFCRICSQPVDNPWGSVRCDHCGNELSMICETCKAQRCPKCKKGKLVGPKMLFPNNLFEAIRTGDESKVDQILLGRKEDLNEIYSTSGSIPLMDAVIIKDSKKAESIAKKLIDFGARPDSRDMLGRTPLMNMVRCRSFHPKIFDLFKMTVNSVDNERKTALMFAAKGAGSMASRKGNTEIVRHLLRIGADPMISDNNGQTALGHAKKSNDTRKNEKMIDILEEEVINRTAVKIFLAHNSYEFDDRGQIHVSPRK